jgi:hypothetical protein
VTLCNVQALSSTAHQFIHLTQDRNPSQTVHGAGSDISALHVVWQACTRFWVEWFLGMPGLERVDVSVPVLSPIASELERPD